MTSHTPELEFPNNRKGLRGTFEPVTLFNTDSNTRDRPKLRYISTIIPQFRILAGVTHAGSREPDFRSRTRSETVDKGREGGCGAFLAASANSRL